jgi:hypothetical protein
VGEPLKRDVGLLLISMRRTLTATTVFFIAVAAIASGVEYQKRRNETPSERFYRKGGKETKADVYLDHGALTTSGIALKRDLTIYDYGGHIDCRVGMVRYSDETAKDVSKERCQLSKLRDFVWEHWQTKKRAYIRISFDTVDAVSTSHLFIEPDRDGQWQVAWRIARHTNEITDIPEIRDIRQRLSTREDIECRCAPGTTLLSFIDWEGDEIQSL